MISQNLATFSANIHGFSHLKIVAKLCQTFIKVDHEIATFAENAKHEFLKNVFEVAKQLNEFLLKFWGRSGASVLIL